ncbi:MAG: 16S rRNA (adenine(1518)-N(6)/adenine(1519)-N(6))-dimethyltransferase RsmA [Chloroflexota bacterium]|nr:16S rRNA (adenine(1518)-N(6)/adenine(1519)-N(6))-dimethyltransferase RsmA [Chloroflexota bacterium]
MTAPSIANLLRIYDFDPKKSLGQNFLVDEQHLDRIAAAADLTADDTVLEIGPGLGGLTRRLAAQSGHVVGVELDERLLPILRAQFATQAHVSIVHGDILKLNPVELVRNSQFTIHNSPFIYKVVANLPYYITSAVIRHLLEADQPPSLAVLMLQKEVAERICAVPGDLSLLAVSVQFYAQPTIVHHVPASAFYPRPKVDSAVLRLDVLPQRAVPDVAPDFFFRIVRAGFSQKRKQLLNTISAGLHLPKLEAATALEEAGIDPKRRAETLTLPEWGKLCRVLALKTDPA